MSVTTKRALAASLRKLLARKTIDRITVKEITDDCGVNRQTFYYHFQDVYDLMEWIFKEDVANLMGEYQETGAFKDGLKRLFAYMDRNRVLIVNAYHSLSWEHLRDAIAEVARPIIAEMVEEESKDKGISDSDKNFIVASYISWIVGLALEWVDGNMSIDYNQKIDRFFLLLNGSVGASLENFAHRAGPPE